MRISEFERRNRQSGKRSWWISIPSFCIVAIPFVVLVNRQWWASIPPRVANTGFVVLLAIAAVAAYKAFAWSSEFVLRRCGLECPNCGRSLFGSDAGETVRTTGRCPSCGAQVIESGDATGVGDIMPAQSRAALVGTPRVRYSPVRQWRGFLVIVAWILSPMRWVAFDSGPKECATGNCFGDGGVWHSIAVLWSLCAPGIIASIAWLAWHGYRARISKERRFQTE